MNYYSHHIGDFDSTVKRHTMPAVYVLSTPNFEFIKIGVSTALKQRLTNIQTACPFEIELWLTIRSPKHKEIEAHLHERMQHCKTKGEWFAPDSDDLDDLLDFFVRTNQHVREIVYALL